MSFLRYLLPLVVCVGVAQAQLIIRVDKDVSSPAPDGSTWASAFATIQAGIQAALSGGGGEVWVAEGTYTGLAGNPTDADGLLVGATTVILEAGVHLYGGFGGGETDVAQRDWVVRPTIIDGENIRRGVFSSGIAAGEARLDGFTVRRGHADTFGGGIYNDRSAPTIINTRIEDSHADQLGGGLFNFDSPDQTISNITVADNTATLAGGGAYIDAEKLSFADCVFEGNTAALGGGIYDSGGETRLFRCTLRGNTASDAGGGYCYEGVETTEFTNCLLDGNRAENEGGGIYHDG